MSIKELMQLCVLTMMFQSLIQLSKQLSSDYIVLSTSHAQLDRRLYTVNLLIHYLIGPLVVFKFGYLLTRMHFRFLFFLAAISKVLNLLFSVLLLENTNTIQIILLTLMEVILSPAWALFYCTYNYYIYTLTETDNKGLYYGLAYTLYCCSSFISTNIYIIIQRHGQNQLENIRYIILVLALVVACFYWTIGNTLKLKRKFYTNPRELVRVLRQPIKDIFKTCGNVSVLGLLQSLITIYLVQSMTPQITKMDESDFEVSISIYRSAGLVIGGLFTTILSDTFDTQKIVIINQTVLSALFLIFIPLAYADMMTERIPLQIYAFMLGGLFSQFLSTTLMMIGNQLEEYPQILAFYTLIYCLVYAGINQLRWIDQDESHRFILIVAASMTLINLIIQSRKARESLMLQYQISSEDSDDIN